MAAAAYMSCSTIINEYDGVHHDYTRKGGLVWQQTFLPQQAPTEWKQHSVLWNAVEESEKAKDNRLAREIVVALPTELTHNEQIELVSAFIQTHFVADGMCADVAIHDTDGHNPHAHIMLTVRPLDDHGQWQYKTEKEYVCIRNGEERGLTAAEFLQAHVEGWEKQYPYIVGKKKVYMTASDGEAQGLQRASKYAKSTTYGRQNPISERWNSEEQLLLWRSAWADAVNQHLEQAGYDERIDHRSHATRGIDEHPTIHEGVAARIMEQKGLLSDRCAINRQIKADNALLRQLKNELQKLLSSIRDSLPAFLETLRARLILLQYQLLFNRKQLGSMEERRQKLTQANRQYKTIQGQIKAKNKKRKDLLAEEKACNPLNLLRLSQINRQLTTVTEEWEELKTQKHIFLNTLGCNEQELDGLVKRLNMLAESKDKLEQQQAQLAEQKATTKDAFLAAKSEISDDELMVVQSERERLRPAHREELLYKLQETYGQEYRYEIVCDAESIIDNELVEATLFVHGIRATEEIATVLDQSETISNFV